MGEFVGMDEDGGGDAEFPTQLTVRARLPSPVILSLHSVMPCANDQRRCRSVARDRRVGAVKSKLKLWDGGGTR